MGADVHAEGVMEVATRLLERLSVRDADQVRVRMSWADYLALPDELSAEFVDDEVVVSPRPPRVHGRVVARLSHLLLNSLPPALDVLADGGLRLPARRLRGPDLMVLADRSDATWVEEVPLLVVEVLSRSTRSEDLLRKGPEYAAAGVGQFWVVDPDARRIEVDENVDGAWRLLVRVDDDLPTADVAVGDHGRVPLDLWSILR